VPIAHPVALVPPAPKIPTGFGPILFLSRSWVKSTREASENGIPLEVSFGAVPASRRRSTHEGARKKGFNWSAALRTSAAAHLRATETL
jgi:uncharacterized membrane protein